MLYKKQIYENHAKVLRKSKKNHAKVLRKSKKNHAKVLRKSTKKSYKSTIVKVIN